MNLLACARLRSRISSLALFAVLAAALVFSLSGCDKLRARDALNKGVDAYKNGLFDSAIEYFKKAEELDPNLINARLYLATAYASQFIPGAPSEENVQKGQQAIAEFQKVSDMDPKNLSALDGIGSMLYNMGTTPYDAKKLEESKKYHLQHIQIKPDDPEPYYWIGVIDWSLAYHANDVLRADYNKANPRKQVRDADPLPPKVSQEYAAKYSQAVDEGLQMLDKAVQLRPDYDDAIGYQNLLLRRKADMVEDMKQRDELEKQADALLDKVKEIKQRKAEAAAK